MRDASRQILCIRASHCVNNVMNNFDSVVVVYIFEEPAKKETKKCRNTTQRNEANILKRKQ